MGSLSMAGTLNAASWGVYRAMAEMVVENEERLQVCRCHIVHDPGSSERTLDEVTEDRVD